MEKKADEIKRASTDKVRRSALVTELATTVDETVHDPTTRPEANSRPDDGGIHIEKTLLQKAPVEKTELVRLDHLEKAAEYARAKERVEPTGDTAEPSRAMVWVAAVAVLITGGIFVYLLVQTSGQSAQNDSQTAVNSEQRAENTTRPAFAGGAEKSPIRSSERGEPSSEKSSKPTSAKKRRGSSSEKQKPPIETRTLASTEKERTPTTPPAGKDKTKVETTKPAPARAKSAVSAAKTPKKERTVKRTRRLKEQTVKARGKKGAKPKTSVNLQNLTTKEKLKIVRRCSRTISCRSRILSQAESLNALSIAQLREFPSKLDACVQRCVK